MSIQITYNNINPFSGQPVPFIARLKDNISYGERWGSIEKISLIGQLTGCDFSDLTSAQFNLLSGFSKDFQTLKIIQTGVEAASFENIFVDSINFQNSNYLKILPYQIDLSFYPQNFFTGFYGILDPSDEWTMSQSEEGLVEVSHKVSARGMQTLAGFNALDNAKNFVLSRTGLSNYVSPAFITKILPSGILKSQVENINRLSATYSVTESFVLDQFYPSDYGILRYKVDLQKNQAGFNSASIEGSFEGGIKDDFSLIKNRASDFDYYSSLMYALDSGVKINPIPLNKKIIENDLSKKIDFSLSYDDNPNYQTNLAYAVAINSGEDFITVSVNGEINGRGDLANKWTRVNEAYDLFNPFIIASQEFSVYSAGGILDSNPTSESVSYDKFNGSISFDFSYQDKPLPPNSNLLSFDYDINYTPPLRKINVVPLIIKSSDNTYYKYEVTDMGFDRRGSISIDGEAIAKRDVSLTTNLESTKNAIRGLYTATVGSYSNIYLEKYSLGQNNSEKVTFSINWSYEGPGAIIESDYSRIDSL